MNSARYILTYSVANLFLHVLALRDPDDFPENSDLDRPPCFIGIRPTAYCGLLSLEEATALAEWLDAIVLRFGFPSVGVVAEIDAAEQDKMAAQLSWAHLAEPLGLLRVVVPSTLRLITGPPPIPVELLVAYDLDSPEPEFVVPEPQLVGGCPR